MFVFTTPRQYKEDMTHLHMTKGQVPCAGPGPFFPK